MKKKTIVILIATILMLIINSAAEQGTIVLEETLEGYMIDATIDYDATVEDYWDAIKYNGEYDIEGIVNIEGKSYKADFDATGGIYMKEEKVIRLNLHVDGKIYQYSEVGYLYKEKDTDYYGYIENGYNTNGDIYFCKNTGPSQGGDVLFFTNFVLDGYSKYIITKTITQEDNQFTLSSPALGIGYKGSVMGDIIPALYTYRDQDTGKRVVSESYPTDHNGPVICTPARIAGEPLFPSDFWTTPKGIRMLEMKAR